MGGVAAVIALGLGGILYKVNPSYPFYMGSIIMLLAVIIMYLFVKEPHELDSEEEQNKPNWINWVHCRICLDDLCTRCKCNTSPAFTRCNILGCN